LRGDDVCKVDGTVPAHAHSTLDAQEHENNFAPKLMMKSSTLKLLGVRCAGKT
jgi:hypothetical protein